MKIKIDYKLDNWNSVISRCRSNKYGANSNKRLEMNIISKYLKDMKPIKEYPVEIIFYWHIKSKISDLDNKSAKAILDTMQNMGILANDNVKYIRKITYIAIIDNKDYVEMEVKKYGID
jgi:Holliday junction resolvase RusA-like endonuclease